MVRHATKDALVEQRAHLVHGHFETADISAKSLRQMITAVVQHECTRIGTEHRQKFLIRRVQLNYQSYRERRPATERPKLLFLINKIIRVIIMIIPNCDV